MTNPILSREFRIPFHEVRPEHVEPGVRQALADARTALDALVQRQDAPTYATTVQALDDLTERLGRAFGIVSHLVNVAQTPELREAFNAVLPEVSAFYAKLPTNEGLWRALKAFAETDEAAALDGVRRRHLDKTVREFRRAGADLSPKDKARVEAIKVELAQLGNAFQNNLLDGTNAWEKLLDDEAALAGLPESARRMARAAAAAKGLPGYRLTLQAPSYLAVMKHADDRELRREMLEAFQSRGSGAGRDNRPLIPRLLELRRELARLLGYDHYADYVLAERMVGGGDRAQDFERDLTEAVEPHFRAEVAELEAYAAERGVAPLEPWDLRYFEERLRQERFAVDDEALRPYFPVDRVLSGLFEIARRLFGVEIRSRANEAVWDPEVKFYEVYGADGTHLGSFYADWFPRENKRAGAWMNPLITGGPDSEGGFRPHLGFLAGNFTPPEAGAPALLTHNEVRTTFHEFGHLLHHILSRVEVPARGGTHVAWDFVELPSQLMENWIWERDALDEFARHVDTGERLPDALFHGLSRARTFAGGRHMMGQLSLGSVDLALHIDYDPASADDPIDFGNRVMERFAVRPEFAHNDFLATFSHIFAGGYAAGYYSYMWSEVLDADVFTRFREAGIFDPRVGRELVEAILSRGDSAEPAELFRAFMGRDPDLQALLRRNLQAGPGAGAATVAAS